MLKHLPSEEGMLLLQVGMFAEVGVTNTWQLASGSGICYKNCIFFWGRGGGGWIRILSNPPNNFGRTLLFVVSLHIITFMRETNINDLTIFFKTTNMAEFLVKHNFLSVKITNNVITALKMIRVRNTFLSKP